MKEFLINLLGGFTYERVRTFINNAVRLELEGLMGLEASDIKSMRENIKRRIEMRDRAVNGGKVVFVSLPITGYMLMERKQHAKTTADLLMKKDGVVKVVTPFDMPGFKENMPWDWYEHSHRCRTATLCTSVKVGRRVRVVGWRGKRRKEENFNSFFDVRCTMPNHVPCTMYDVRCGLRLGGHKMTF